MNKQTLYGLDKNGGHKVWSIWTSGSSLFIEHGKLGGKLQVKEEHIEGKNIGRANETSPAEQAEKEAQSRYQKQLDKNYRPSIDELEAGQIDLLPMLAQDYRKHGHKIKYPCYGSYKLDGVRCLAICDAHGNVKLVSRGGKNYDVQHIISSLEQIMEAGEIWDGEIYIHGKYLEEIVSAVKKPNADTPNLKYYVFDIVDPEHQYHNRSEDLNALAKWEGLPNFPSIEVLKDFHIRNEDDMKRHHAKAVELGYEGIMLRNADGMYEWGKRSNDLQKYKQMLEEEFQVVGIEEDKNGNAVLVLKDEVSGSAFTCCYGDFEERKRQLSNPSDYIGRMLTVAYQTRYKDSRLPQFGVGKCWRDYE